ncbi:MAG: LL-diaminopimelate aminotransferase, partial [Prevotellaceae bacterium]|nr:LL-diaminopimelate aminotransferase [Prevotellaceae bacterium]
MAYVNENFLRLPGNYLFAEIASRVNDYKAYHPHAHVISLGIGDVTQPLAPAVVEAMQRAASEQASAATMRGYAPDRGYPFLIDAIVRHDFAQHDIDVRTNEVFISDG